MASIIRDKYFGINIEKLSPDELLGPLNEIEKKFSPSCLFLIGNRKLMHLPRVSIIGTRNPSDKGLENTCKLTKCLIEKNIVIVSGLAIGIDTVAHKTSIENHGNTIAVLGNPLDKYYPTSNHDLQNEIMKHHLVISQFPIGTPIQRKNFPMRNRTMALISNVSIITEAGENSGTIHQGWEALRLGRPLFILEDMVNNKKLKWPHQLIEYGAKILSIEKLKNVFESLPHPVEGLENNVAF